MKRFIAILLLCLVVGTSVAAQTPGQQHARSEIDSTRIVIATAIRLLQWRFGILPTGDGLTPPVPGPTGDLLIPPVPRPNSDGLEPPIPRPNGGTKTCCK